jgi:hypothetical protein
MPRTFYRIVRTDPRVSQTFFQPLLLSHTFRLPAIRCSVISG